MKAVLFALGFAAFALSVTTDFEDQGGELVYSVETRCKGPFNIGFFEDFYGDDPMDRYFCGDYLLDREFVLAPVQLDQGESVDFFLNNPIIPIGILDEQAHQNFLSGAAHLSSACNRGQLRAMICAETFPQCTKSDDEEFSRQFSIVPECKEFCTYTLGCTFDVEQCKSAQGFDIDDPEACAFYDPTLVSSSSIVLATGLISLLG